MKPSDRWPVLPLAKWKDTYATLHYFRDNPVLT
jgi:hypothetical protein